MTCRNLTFTVYAFVQLRSSHSSGPSLKLFSQVLQTLEVRIMRVLPSPALHPPSHPFQHSLTISPIALSWGSHYSSSRLPTLLYVPCSGPRVTGCHLSDGVQDEAALTSVSCGTSKARGMHCAHSIVSLWVLLTSTWRLHFGPLKRATDDEQGLY